MPLSDESSPPALEILRIARIESRAVLDHRIALVDDIDNKALRTVRTLTVILALLVSAGKIAGPAQLQSLHWIAVASVAVAIMLFSLALVIGMAIYSVSQVPFGVGSTHRSEALTGGYSEREWLTLLLEEYDGWTTEIRELTENNARWFTYVQGLFVTG